MKNITVIGNCQADVLCKIFDIFLPSANIEHNGFFRYASLEEAQSYIKRAHYIFYNANPRNILDDLPQKVKLIRFPKITFEGWFPDDGVFEVPYHKDPSITHTVPHIPIIATVGYYEGLNKDDIIELYNEKTYQTLGYFDKHQQSINILIQHGKECDYDLTEYIDKHLRTCCNMLLSNHPNIDMMVDLANMILIKEGFLRDPKQINHFIADPLQENFIHSVFPEIAIRHGCSGSYYYKYHHKNGNGRICDFQEFLSGFYDENLLADPKRRFYDDISFSNIDISFVRDALFGDKQHQVLSLPDNDKIKNKYPNPYDDVAAEQKWYNAVSDKTFSAIDPVGNVRFNIRDTDKIVSAGSCFAQHISGYLQQYNLNYLINETDGTDAQQLFSAQYGNIYTAKQLLQLIQQVIGDFKAQDTSWQIGHQQYIDPFRPNIANNIFSSRNKVLSARKQHLEYVRNLFVDMDIFIFTIGLTEAWQSSYDGAIFPVHPHVVGAKVNRDDYIFKNFNITETITDLQQCYDLLKSLNKNVKIILTVSPVPLIATYENRHVIQSTCYSKSLLRVAVQSIIDQYDDVDYFPSYEIITENKNHYFASDRRTIIPSGIHHVMRLFMQYYADIDITIPDANPAQQALFDIICDEEMSAW